MTRRRRRTNVNPRLSQRRIGDHSWAFLAIIVKHSWRSVSEEVRRLLVVWHRFLSWKHQILMVETEVTVATRRWEFFEAERQRPLAVIHCQDRSYPMQYRSCTAAVHWGSGRQRIVVRLPTDNRWRGDIYTEEVGWEAVFAGLGDQEVCWRDRTSHCECVTLHFSSHDYQSEARKRLYVHCWRNRISTRISWACIGLSPTSALS